MRMTSGGGSPLKPWFRRYGKALLASAALLVALTVTVYRTDPPGLVGFQFTADQLATANAASSAGAAKPYDLARLRVLNSTLQRVRDNYVDPTRIDPRGMLFAALDQVQRSVPEILVEPQNNKKSVLLRVDTAQNVFAVDNVDSPWALSAKLGEIFTFVQANLPATADARDIEYAAVNGMLSTLDPHSVLLDPATYREMKVDTRGKFGGLGIEISIRRDLLTVINVLPGTPAARGGLRAGDHILRINDESTINMLLTEAVSRLRGEPSTKVSVYIERDGQQGLKKIVLERAIIDMQYVVGPRIKNGIGYVKIKQFAGNTSDDLRKALADLHKQGMKGLILDLRSNPGGLLDQAIQVSDAFIESGTIVTTVGYAGKQREERRARAQGVEPHFPMVVLVDGRSASASEIVAGALKNLERAVIMGQTSFGKGSVQVLYDNDDDSALKLTIAQYLTPGDVSIQSVGITPDVEAQAARVEKDNIWLSPSEHSSIRESELEQHLDSHNAKKGEKPLEVVRYLAPDLNKNKAKPPTPKSPPKNPKDTVKNSKDPKVNPAAPAVDKDDDDDDADDGDDEDDEGPVVLPMPDRNADDFEIEMARNMLLSLPQGAWRRREVLTAARPFFEKARAEENQKVAAALGKLGIDWSVSADLGAAKLVGSVTTDKANHRFNSGETIKLRATVKNEGTVAAEQVRGQIKADDFLFDEREIIFGKVKPGESKTVEIPVKIPKHVLTHVDELQVRFSDAHQSKIAPVTAKVHITGLPRPVFAYTYQIVDDVRGNKDGLVQRGEQLRLVVTVKNLGPGRSYRTQATLKNNTGAGVFIDKGRFRLDNIAPGQTRQVAFELDVSNETQDDSLQLELAVADQTLREVVNEKLKFPIGKAPGPQVQPQTGFVTVNADKTDVRATAQAGSTVLGQVKKGTVLTVSGKTNDAYRVEVEQGRPAFVSIASVEKKGDKAGAGFEPAWLVSPPVVTLDTTALETTEGKIRVHGFAKDERRVADIYVIVANRRAKVDFRKVYYKSNRKSQDPTKLEFDATVPLWPGENYVQVIARETPQVQSRSTVVVLRTQPPGPAIAQQPQPQPSSSGKN